MRSEVGLLIYFWLCWTFMVLWLSLVAERWGCSPTVLGFSLQRLLLLQNTGSKAGGLPKLRLPGSAPVMTHGLSWSKAVGSSLTRDETHVPFKAMTAVLCHSDRPGFKCLRIISWNHLCEPICTGHSNPFWSCWALHCEVLSYVSFSASCCHSISDGKEHR